jgi:hypothetical protein
VNTTISQFPLSQYPNKGPAGSGPEWSRVVAIANAAFLKCPVQVGAAELAKYSNVWKCECVNRQYVRPQSQLTGSLDRWNSVLAAADWPAYLGGMIPETVPWRFRN